MYPLMNTSQVPYYILQYWSTSSTMGRRRGRSRMDGLSCQATTTLARTRRTPSRVSWREEACFGLMLAPNDQVAKRCCHWTKAQRHTTGPRRAKSRGERKGHLVHPGEGREAQQSHLAEGQRRRLPTSPRPDEAQRRKTLVLYDSPPTPSPLTPLAHTTTWPCQRPCRLRLEQHHHHCPSTGDLSASPYPAVCTPHPRETS